MCAAIFSRTLETLSERHNPIVRRVVRRTRPMLEERGLLKRIGVIAHPRAGDGLPSVLFDGDGLVMSLAFNAAYEAAEAFSRLYAARHPGAGFLKTILLRRIGSSARAGLETRAISWDVSTFLCLRRRLATKDCQQMMLRLIRRRSNYFERLNEISLRWLAAPTPIPRCR